MRTAIYARSRTANGSIAEQLRRTELYCRERGYTVVARFLDPNVAGLTPFEHRTGFSQLRRAVHAGKLDVVVVADLHRISRSPIEVGLIQHEFHQFGTIIDMALPPADTGELELINFVERYLIEEQQALQARARARRGERFRRVRVTGYRPPTQGEGEGAQPT